MPKEKEYPTNVPHGGVYLCTNRVNGEWTDAYLCTRAGKLIYIIVFGAEGMQDYFPVSCNKKGLIPRTETDSPSLLRTMLTKIQNKALVHLAKSNG
jgi:hypothetical protein